MTEDNITVFAKTNFRNQDKVFGIKKGDRRRHMYVIGKTGMGKTSMLENMIISDILSGEGCCYIDPHGDTAEKLLDFIPSNRINDVIYFNPADNGYPIAFNILESVDETSKHLVASGLVGVFKKQFADSWGPRLEYILRNAILALLDYPGSTLLGIMRILVDKSYRKKVVGQIKDPVVKSFWTNEYTQWNDRVLQEVISPIQNKVGQFLSNALIRNIVGQVKSTIDLRDVMDKKKILILNLSKGRIGEDTMQLLGSMMVTKLYLSAMSRVDIGEEQRSDFYLYVDEFQNFATESFASILSESRKYRLNLIIAHQYIEQLPEEVSSAVFGNIGSLVSFRVGAVDADELVKEFTPVFTEEDLVNLPAFHIYLRLMIDGVVSDPFSATTLPPLYDDLITHNEDKVIKVSRERYAQHKEVVEDKINRWSGIDLSDKVVRAVADGRSRRSDSEDGDSSKIDNSRDNNRRQVESGGGQSGSYDASKNKKNKNKKKHRETYEIICDVCGDKDEVHFKPDSNKPILCQKCLDQGLKDSVMSSKDDLLITPSSSSRVKSDHNQKNIKATVSDGSKQPKKPSENHGLNSQPKSDSELSLGSLSGPGLSLTEVASLEPIAISHIPKRSGDRNNQIKKQSDEKIIKEGSKAMAQPKVDDKKNNDSQDAKYQHHPHKEFKQSDKVDGPPADSSSPQELISGEVVRFD